MFKMFKKLFISLLAIVGFTFLLSSNSYAVSDVTYTATANSNSGYTFCGSNTGVSCSDYHYLLITTNFGFNTTTSYASMAFIYDNATQSTSRLYLNSPSLLLDTSDFTVVAVNNINNTASLPSDWSVTFTLSENNPAGGITPEGTLDITSSGTYDVTNYATAIVDIPIEEVIEDPISNDFQKVFFAIVEKIIPAFGVLLVVWFGIDMLSSLIFGRGR